MTRPYDAYWGKADPTTGGFHLAALHSIDVAAVAVRRIGRSHVLRARLAALLDVPSERVGETVAAFVALHDIGKLDVRFQMKARGAAVMLDPARATYRVSGSYDHGGWGYFQTRRELQVEVRRHLGANVENWADPLLQAVTGHHGELPSKAMRQIDEDAEPFVAADRAARAAFLTDVAALFAARGAALPNEREHPLTFAGVALVAGLCAVSDWIGSQVDYFGYVGEPVALADHLDKALRNADAALDALHVDAPPSRRSFADLFPGKTPRDVQTLTEAIYVDAEPRLVVIEGQMGSGKTEAALALVERMLGAHAAAGFFFALPTMATSNGLFDRVVDVVPRMFEGDVNLLLAHSRARRSLAMRQLAEPRAPPTRAVYGSHAAFDEEASATCAKWYRSSKRALASQVGVGTIDQAMTAALQVRHHFVRLYGLATNVVVLDEIHAYDAYMSVVLDRLVEWLGALRTPVVLLSATLPASRRRAFEDAYYRGAFQGSIPASAARELPSYPLVSTTDKAGHSAHSLSAAPTSYELIVERIHTNDPLRDVLPRLVEESRRGRVAWIRNTVSEAQDAWDAARTAGASPILFHARMRAKDRARAERTVLAGFGRSGTRETGLVIATQVIEQSLDLDFDLIASDLAPIDLLLQRAGRLHRHAERARPAGFERRLIVTAPPNADIEALRLGPSRYVYDAATLWISHDLLRERDRVRVPTDLRELIEATYDPALRHARLAAATAAPLLAEAERSREAKRLTSEHKARACAIPPADFDAAHFRGTDDDDEVVQALTREGSSVTLLPILWNDLAATTLDGRELSLDPDSPDAWREAEVLQDEQVSVPSYRVRGEAPPHGERPTYAAWQKRAHAFFKAMRLGRHQVIVPMARVNDGVFSGRAVGAAGIVMVHYTAERGMWF